MSRRAKIVCALGPASSSPSRPPFVLCRKCCGIAAGLEAGTWPLWNKADHEGDITVSDSEGVGFRPDDDRPGLTRRHFIYGTTAAAAGAVILGGTTAGQALASTAGRLVRGRSAGHVVPAQSQGAFTWIQTGGLVDSSTGSSLSLALTKGSTAGNLLVAVIVSADPAAQFSAPSSHWQLAIAMPTVSTSASGQVEIWYYLGTPADAGLPGRDRLPGLHHHEHSGLPRFHGRVRAAARNLDAGIRRSRPQCRQRGVIRRHRGLRERRRRPGHRRGRGFLRQRHQWPLDRPYAGGEVGIATVGVRSHR